MRILENPKRTDWGEILERPEQDAGSLESVVNEVFKAVRDEGDQALLEYTKKFDGVALETIVLEGKAFEQRAAETPEALKDAINTAKRNIESFHEAQRTSTVQVETMPGVSCWQEKRPIEKVGLYIPGGSAPLFSTVLMLAVPAVLAGCEEIVLCTPPDQDGLVPAAVCYAAQCCGLDRVYRVGGVQAIAAMTFGTASISPVYKLFGPGNQYVTKAKQMATNYKVAIDMPAGPSEVMVVADETAEAAFVAADLLSQAEHGPDSQVILLSTSATFIQAVAKAVKQQLKDLPRKQLAAKAIDNSFLVALPTKEAVLDLMNAYGPEHLIISSADESFYLQGLKNAGSVFLGNYTPESAGDYASGTNHTLPTHGYAKQYSGVNLDSYMKSITFQRITKEGLKSLGPAIEIMAEAEGLQGHKNAVSLRLQKLKNS